MTSSPHDEYVEIIEPAPKWDPVSPAKRKRVDFAAVPPSQWAIHDRLQNWARWARGSEQQSGTAGSPMFNLYRSNDDRDRVYGAETVVPIDKDDAIKVAKAVGHLPPQKRAAIHWCYLRPRDPAGKARELGVDLQGLADLVRDGRTQLMAWV